MACLLLDTQSYAASLTILEDVQFFQKHLNALVPCLVLIDFIPKFKVFLVSKLEILDFLLGLCDSFSPWFGQAVNDIPTGDG